MTLLLGIDLGTSYFKIGLFDPQGEMKGLGRVPVRKHSPRPGHVELAVEEFWRALREGLDEALHQAGAGVREIEALSYSSQATTFVLLDRADAPLTPLILWTDTRGEPVDPHWQAFARGDAFQRTVGFAGLSGFSAVTKWRWFQQQAPDVWSRTARVMTISDYFTFALTGERVGDASTAAFLGLYDLNAGAWWPAAGRKFGVDAAFLSRPLCPGSPCGVTSARATHLLGLPAGVPFAVGALDHHVAAIGSGLGALADLSISTGTVLAALVLADAIEPLAECYHGPHVDGRRFYRLTFDPNGAGQLEEYQRQHAPGESIETLLDRAARAGRNRNAVHDETGWSVREILERVSTTHQRLVHQVLAGKKVQTIVATGGGARSPLWLQINADRLGVPVVTPTCLERACLGAAAFGAVAAGLYPNLSDASSAMVHAGRIYEPTPGRGPSA